jgi:hypothetical protein
MAANNTLTNLIPNLYAAADVVSRELVGFIPAVTRDSSVDRVAINQAVNIPVVGAITPVPIVAGSFSPDTGAASPNNVTVTISNQFAAPVAWNGDEQVAVGETGLYESVMTQRFAQAMRGIVNMVESDLANLHAKASRAVGTFNAAPFGVAGDLSDMALAIKVLEDNGAPTADLRAVLNTSAIANLRGKQSALFKVNESGSDNLLRRGIIGDIFGVGLGASAQVKSKVTVGTVAATTTAAGFAVGATSIALSAAASALLAGDLITFAGDTNVYVVKTAITSGSGGTLEIQEPGLRVAMSAAVKAITVVAATDRNMVFSKSSIVLATRTPYMPAGGDGAADVMDIVDPVSGLAFQVALYRQYRQVHFEIGLAWGVQMIAPRHSVILMG